LLRPWCSMTRSAQSKAAEKVNRTVSGQNRNHFFSSLLEHGSIIRRYGHARIRSH
jgi:hypothetical protein